jgi:uncharacterized protein YcfJ
LGNPSEKTMKQSLKHAVTGGLAAAALIAAGTARADITFYEHDGFDGRNFTTDQRVRNFEREGFNDRASSVVVGNNQRWEVCEDANFHGRCVVLRPGQYTSLSAIGLNDRVSSVRLVPPDAVIAEERYAPQPLAAERDYRRRPDEALFEANVTNVRAVVSNPQQRCWMEQQEVPAEKRNVPGAIAGAVLGGILGHQVGGGSGRDIATVGGAVGGAVVGANVGRQRGGTQEVQRCETVTDVKPDYWDVTYVFRGQEHHAQMTNPPGATLLVNRDGVPRI